MEPVHRLAPPNSFPTRRHSYRRSAFASSAPVWMVLASLAAGPGDGAAKEGYNVWSKERVHRLHQRVLLEPDNVRVRLLLANAYYEDGETWEAKRELRRALEIKPDYPEAHCNLAVILHAQSSLSEARRHYEAALAVDSSLVEAMAGLGVLLCRTGQGRGIDLLERVLAREPGRHSARFNLSVAYHRAGDFPRAIDHLERLLTRESSYPGARQAMAQACFARGLALLQAKRPDAALASFSRALVYDDSDDGLHFAMGLAHLKLDQLPEAEAAFAAAVDLNPEHVPALHNLAGVYERSGRRERARQLYERVALLTPHLRNIEAARNAKYDEEYLFE